jgi:hypothetical protein
MVLETRRSRRRITRSMGYVPPQIDLKNKRQTKKSRNKKSRNKKSRNKKSRNKKAEEKEPEQNEPKQNEPEQNEPKQKEPGQHEPEQNEPKQKEPGQHEPVNKKRIRRPRFEIDHNKYGRDKFTGKNNVYHGWVGDPWQRDFNGLENPSTTELEEEEEEERAIAREMKKYKRHYTGYAMDGFIVDSDDDE